MLFRAIFRHPEDRTVYVSRSYTREEDAFDAASRARKTVPEARVRVQESPPPPRPNTPARWFKYGTTPPEIRNKKESPIPDDATAF